MSFNGRGVLRLHPLPTGPLGGLLNLIITSCLLLADSPSPPPLRPFSFANAPGPAKGRTKEGA